MPVMESKDQEEDHHHNLEEISNQSCSIIQLPDDLFLELLEFCVNHPKEMIRIGCVCRHWRRLILLSPIWCRESMKRFNCRYNSRFLTIIVDERCTSDQSVEISTWYRNNLKDFLLRIQQIELNSRIDEMLYQRKKRFLCCGEILAVFLVVVIGVTFGVNWRLSKRLYFTVGFISIYLLLIIATIYVFLTQQFVISYNRHQHRHRHRRHEQSKLVQYMVVILGIFLSTSLTQYKIFTHSSLLWIEAIIPLWFAVITLTIEYCKALHVEIVDPTWIESFQCLLLPSLVSIPPLLSLFLYCYHLDYHHRHPSSRYNSPYSLLTCLFPISLHLFFSIWYFISHGYKSTSSLCKPSSYWDAYVTTQMKYIRMVMKWMVALASGVGVTSSIIFIILCFPIQHQSILFTQFNLIFYLWLLILSSFLIEFCQRRMISWGVDFEAYLPHFRHIN